MEYNPVDIYLLKVNNRNTRTRCEICSKLTIRIPERRPSVSIVSFEHADAGRETYIGDSNISLPKLPL